MPQIFDMSVRTEVSRAIIDEGPGEVEARETMIKGELQVRVLLVVLQLDIERGSVTLDQVRLEDQGFDFVRCDDRIDVRCLLDELFQSDTVFSQRINNSGSLFSITPMRTKFRS